MALGYPTTKNDIDARAGGLAVDLRQKFRDVQNLKVWLDAELNADLLARGYVQADIDRLRSAVADMDKLAQIYFGMINLPGAYDFRTFTKFLTGVA